MIEITSCLSMRYSLTTTSIDHQKQFLFLILKVNKRLHRYLKVIQISLIMKMKWSQYYKFWLVSLLSMLELKSLKRIRVAFLKSISVNISRFVRQILWKLNALKKLDVVVTMRLIEEICK